MAAKVDDRRHGDKRRTWGFVVLLAPSRKPRRTRRSRGSRAAPRLPRRLYAVAVGSREQADSVIARAAERRHFKNPKLVSRIEHVPSRGGDRVIVVDEKTAPRFYE